MKKFALLVIALIGISSLGEASAQTVITQSYVTAAGCPGGSHTGPPIVLCSSTGNINGSYILGGNISASLGTDGIDIVGNNITLDLGGFNVYGTGPNCSPNVPSPGNSCHTAPGTLFGISISGTNVTVKNGSVHNINGDGIEGSTNTHLKDLQVHDNQGEGVYAGASAVIVNVTASNNSGDGIAAESGSISGSDASSNNIAGLEVFTGGLITSSTAEYNSSAGFFVYFGIASNDVSVANSVGFTALDSQVLNSTASGNVNDGVDFSSGGIGGGGGGGAINTLSSNNGGYGFNMSANSCYSNISTAGNSSAGVSGGASYGVGTVCAH